MVPTQAYQHFGQRSIVAAHTKTIEQRSSLHGISQEQGSDRRISLVDDSFGKRMVVIPNAPHSSVWKKEILSLKSVPSTNNATIHCHKIFVVERVVGCRRQPLGKCVSIEHQIRLRAGGL